MRVWMWKGVVCDFGRGVCVLGLGFRGEEVVRRRKDPTESGFSVKTRNSQCSLHLVGYTLPLQVAGTRPHAT